MKKRYGRTMLRYVAKGCLATLACVITLLLVDAGLLLSGKAILARRNIRSRSAVRGADWRILCVGESTTALGGDHSYPACLERQLNRQLSPQRCAVVNGGVPGTSSGPIVRRLEAQLDEFKPDVLAVMMGVNDGEHELTPFMGQPLDDSRHWTRKLRVVRLARLAAGTFGFAKIRLRAEGARVKRGTADWHYESGRALQEQRLYAEAIAEFRKVLAIQPKHKKAAGQIAASELEMERDNTREWPGSEDREAMHDLPKDASLWEAAWLSHGQRQHDAGHYDDAILSYFRVISRTSPTCDVSQALATLATKGGSPKLGDGYEASFMALGLLVDSCLCSHRKADAHLILENLSSTYPHNPNIARLMYTFYARQGSDRDAARWQAEAQHRSHQSKGRPATQDNFGRLCTIAHQRHIPVVFVQYPARAADDLKAMVSPVACGRIGYVSNEEPFRSIVLEGRQEEVFSDMFAGDFGHCTDLGNSMLASNIATVVLAHLSETEKYRPQP
ncbi:MAG: hypothetical protein HN341_18025 [Verrucomicrobia bacterium]|nr:hypothetical protein [Verrucomicrobiota bacterium]